MFPFHCNTLLMSDSDSDDLTHLISGGVIRKQSTLYRAIYMKDLRAVKILCRQFPYTKNHVCRRKNDKCILNRALECQDINIVEFLCNSFDIGVEDIVGVRFDPANLYSESQEFMKFILSRFNFCGEILANTFMLAIKNGNLWLLQYLWDNHGKKFNFYYAEALCKGASHGHVDVLKFLKGTQTNHDVAVRKNQNGPLRKATAKGHMSVVQYLHTDFGLAASDVVQGGCALAAVFEASKNKRLDFLHYFFHDMGLSPDTVNADRIVYAWPEPKEWPNIREFLTLQGCKFTQQCNQ